MGSLEENAKEILIAYHEGRLPLFEPISKAVNLSDVEIMDATDYLEVNGLWKIVGGTPKSGPAYKITEAGLKYIGITA